MEDDRIEDTSTSTTLYEEFVLYAYDEHVCYGQCPRSLDQSPNGLSVATANGDLSSVAIVPMDSDLRHGALADLVAVIPVGVQGFQVRGMACTESFGTNHLMIEEDPVSSSE